MKFEMDSSTTQAPPLEPTFWMTRHNPEGRKMNVYCRKPSNVMTMGLQNQRLTKSCYATLASFVKQVYVYNTKITQYSKRLGEAPNSSQ